MKIHLVSDLHLECGYQALPGGEVLILAGDVAEAKSISTHFHSTKLLVDTPIEEFRCSEFFYHECAKYDQVFYVMGNHEHYRGRYDKTYEVLKTLLPKNVTLLEQEVVEYCGVMFMGGTLWTDCNQADWHTIYHLKQCMNDYLVVQNHYKDRNVYHRLIPEVTINTHHKTKEYFKTILELNRDKPFVVITHHAPTFMSVHPRYRHDTLMNGGYTSNLGEFILDNENIKVWVHGHMHDPVDYMVGNTRVLANPRGYFPYEKTGFDPDFTFEVAT